MNQQEVKQLLTVAASMDSTMLPADDAALLTKVAVWANALRQIDYEDGMAAVYDHYKRDTTKSVSVGIIYQACQGSRTPSGEHYFTDCNPIVVAPQADAWGGRYEVWCRRCGFQNSAYADTIGEAQLLRDNHHYTPPTFTADEDREADARAQQIGEWAGSIAQSTMIPEEQEDWSEARNHRD